MSNNMNINSTDAHEPEEGLKTPSKKWVKFDDELKSTTDTVKIDDNNVTATDTKSININGNTSDVVSSPSKSPSNNSAVLPTESVQINIPSQGRPTNDVTASHMVDMSNIDLRESSNGMQLTSSNNVIRQGFVNGDVIVTLLPINTRFPWITPAKFRPELVPEELMAQSLTLTVEDYVHVMEILTNDVRFTLYNICYKRILMCWVSTAFIVLLALLFSGVQGLMLFSFGISWLIFNGAAIFLSMWIKIKLNYNLERCMAQVNKHLIRHKILLGLDDRGKISCHKVNLCFIYFDTTECVKKLQEVIEKEEAEGRRFSSGQMSKEEDRARKQFRDRMDIDDQDIVIQGSNTTRLSRKQERGEQLLTRYIQRWSKDYLRRRLDWTMDADGGNPMDPRHLTSALCPCQYIEEYLRFKPRVDKRVCCPCFNNYLKERGVD